ncbi:MAG: bifunctional 5,10-methylenetetrahydrofolate dehydrogenase/5,10-methenyltetrahydrofolate cyclohydrolase [Ignavibacteriales bacterium]|nr:bifunctional 5,10-methylenetetrahydrofolate dehydrogenase/5,10-methenyltetrahydrofolate cyclohydrolase [Ignavibacteriales bacterium]
MIIDGKKISQQILLEVKEETEKLNRERNIVPGLAFLIVGENPASLSYVKSKGKACDEMGFFSVTEKLPPETSETQLLRLIEQFNKAKRIHGILVQLPLPKHINEEKIIEAIDFRKDVDGFHPINVGKLVAGQKCFLPCTPSGIYELLLRSNIETSGKHVVVVGRSNIVGKPIANILLQKQSGNAIVTIVHTGAKDISHFTKQADILIVAIGKPNFLTKEMVKQHAVVIDVGINRVEDLSAKTGYKIVGDVDFENVKNAASAITPVPGGVGPMTIAMLMKNTLLSAMGEIYK